MIDETIKVVEKKGSVVLDTGLILEYLANTELGKIIQLKIIDNKKIRFVYSSQINVTELLYVLCRQLDFSEAQKIILNLTEIVDIVSTDEIWELAAKIKCRRAIAMADCFGIACSTYLQAPIIFLSEAELVETHKKEPFSELVFLLNQ